MGFAGRGCDRGLDLWGVVLQEFVVARAISKAEKIVDSNYVELNAKKMADKEIIEVFKKETGMKDITDFFK